jgi:nucleotide-binding universal stress UspA family protein
MSGVAVKLQTILLPVDVSRDSLTAIDVAFDLAAALGAQVSGIFVEDTRLLTAASLPLTREVGSSSGIAESIDAADILKRLRSVANKARDLLLQTGQRAKVSSSFRVARGDVTSEILSAADHYDLLVLGKAGWTIGTMRKPGSTCLAVLSRSRVPVLIVEEGVRLAPPILAVHDGSESGKRVLDFARHLGEVLGWEVGVFSAQGMATGDTVLERIGPKAALIVLPVSLPLTSSRSRLKSLVLFVP